MISFFVHGDPKPAGSKRAFVLPNLRRAVVVDANKNSKDWKTDVRRAALAVVGDDFPLIEGAVMLRLCFYQLRPKSHFRTGKNSALLRDGAPARPISKPDVLKLARGVEDALTGVVWKDDAQIVDEILQKSYGDRPGVVVDIVTLANADALLIADHGRLG